MARPFQKPAGQAYWQYWCPSCEEWYSTDDFTEGTYYNCDGGYVEVGGEYYYDDYTSWEIWTHDDCSEPVSDLDGSPQSRKIDAAWVCGACKSEYEDYDSANDCCE